MDVKNFLSIMLICLISISSITNQAEELSTEAALIKAHGLYQSSIDAKDFVTAELYAKQSYNLSKNLNGDDHIYTAVLAYNYAKLHRTNQLSQRRPNLQKAIPLLEQAVRVYEMKYGVTGLELIKPLMELGSVYSRLRKKNSLKISLEYYQRALKIVEANDDSYQLTYAGILLEIGKIYSKSRKNLPKARKSIQKTYDIYHQKLPVKSNRRMRSAFWLAKVHYQMGKNSKAEPLFLEVLDIYEDVELSSTSQMVQTINAFLVKLYEKMGERDKATAFCQAIGRAKPWDYDKDLIPLFIQKPLWPKVALQRGKEATIRVGFIVDAEGFVKDPKVLDLKGHKSFQKPALKAINQWRFAPRFVDGQPVESKTAYTMEFKLNK